MGRGSHQINRGLSEIIAGFRAKGDHLGLVKLFATFDGIRNAAQRCDIGEVDRLTTQLDQLITNIGETENA